MTLLKRLQKFVAPPAADPATLALYRTCVAQARAEGFYRSCGVPDTIDGRFDLLLLHIVLVMRRLKDATTAKQALFDLMFADMDRSLREMGVGDMSIGKKMHPMIAAFYGRAQAYEKGMASDAALEEALKRNLYGAANAAPENIKRLAAYVRRATSTLEKMPLDAILTGQLSFPGIEG